MKFRLLALNQNLRVNVRIIYFINKLQLVGAKVWKAQQRKKRTKYFKEYSLMPLKEIDNLSKNKVLFRISYIIPKIN
jgi:hypothetical protein